METQEGRQEECSYSPLKANMEPFFICMKESKGVPLQTSASGSGASVVSVVTATVAVASGVAAASRALVVRSTAGGSVGETGVDAKAGLSGRGDLPMSSEESGRWYGLRPKSVAGLRVGLSRRLLAGIGDGEAPSSGSSS